MAKESEILTESDAWNIAKEAIQEHEKTSEKLLDQRIRSIHSDLEKILGNQDKQQLRDEERDLKIIKWQENWGQRLQDTITSIAVLGEKFNNLKEDTEKQVASAVQSQNNSRGAFEKVLKLIVLIGAAIGMISLIGYLAYYLVTRPMMAYQGHKPVDQVEVKP